MQGFLFYMILGGLLTIYRMYFEGVSEESKWSKERKSTMDSFSNYPIIVQVVCFLVMALFMVPITLTDYTMFFLGKFKNRKYNSRQVKEDVMKYVYYGLFYGESVSYSMNSRFTAEESEEIEKVFKIAEARIIQHGFIPLSIGNFVEAYQDGKALPRLKIKGKEYPAENLH